MVADLGEHARRYRFVVRSQAGQFAASFDAVLADAGIEVVKIPPRCPAGELLRRAPRVDHSDRAASVVYRTPIVAQGRVRHLPRVE